MLLGLPTPLSNIHGINPFPGSGLKTPRPLCHKTINVYLAYHLPKK